ncbi:helix-turn-helix domain-containing protein [Candidatus Kuenenia stuttgartiensis]|uniref:Helix-turn-helix domain protein n=1 Tax=Kuenenia stuttgartiensis TaxID=174633 RepID=A0A2C9CAX1_KUEST|nr:helix-turn-helix domain-containing protein [Candidatus Kuenenia stuttgartiensis]SOH02805.1 Helix-turn-helix domain protein [Candidatus Kuenenia stuttgartiensis]
MSEETVKLLLSMDEACRVLSLKKSTLYQMVMRRQIPVCKIGRLNRFRMEDLQVFIKENMIHG